MVLMLGHEHLGLPFSLAARAPGILFPFLSSPLSHCLAFLIFGGWDGVQRVNLGPSHVCHPEG